ncbi:MAG TPA: hypothetical protein VFX35_00430, partial [Solirubrobacterales bacterium]|nr:hypothetical protein [Solirubrobacterales bacterium]
ARKYEMVRLAEHEGDHWRVVPADLVESYLGSQISYEHVTAVDLQDVEPPEHEVGERLAAVRKAFEEDS